MPAPKVNYQEIISSIYNIARGATMAFVGPASKGKLQQDTLIMSSAQLINAYGNPLSGSDALACAFQALQMGARVRFSRTVHQSDVTDWATRGSAASTITITDSKTAPDNEDTLKVSAKEEGTYADDVTVTIAAATSGVAAQFKMTISSPGYGIVSEVYDNITIGDVESLLSENWVFENLDSTNSSPDNRPKNGTYTLAGGNDGTTGLSDTTNVGSLNCRTGIYGFTTFDFLDVFVPDAVTNAAHLLIKTWAESRRVLAHLSAPTGLSATDIVAFRNCTGSYSGGTAINSSFCALHYGDLKFVDITSPVGATADYVNAGGMAGILARNDTVQTDSQNTPGPWLVPSGRLRGQVANAQNVTPDLANDAGTRDTLAENQINWFQLDSGIATHHGNYTLQQDLTKLTKHLHIRRLLLAIERALIPVFDRAMYELNDPVLWRTVWSEAYTILMSFQDKRALSPDSTGFGFVINCDQDARTADEAVLNTAQVRDNNQFKTNIRIRPTNCALFIDINVFVDGQGTSYAEG